MLHSIGNMPVQYDWFSPVEIKSAIEGLKGNKASGTDNVFAEQQERNFTYCQCLALVLKPAWYMVFYQVGPTMTNTILVPIIKDKTGNASSKANYSPPR